ncbi:MAG: hypothetical protein LRY73_15855 [Bacillus sp. (in: Bacteria)]|nr:hypothetical protein [Bacillus sp. (in: firmicutes)]
MAKSTMYLTGVLIGGAIAGTTIIFTNPEMRARFEDELFIYKETMARNFQDIKRDLQELVYIGEELKEKALSFLNERLPEVMERLRQFIDEVKPQLMELKEYVYELQQYLGKLQEHMNSWTKNA